MIGLAIVVAGLSVKDDEMFRKLRDMTICGICEKCNESLEH